MAETRQVITDNITGITIFPNNSLLIEFVQQASGLGGAGTYICEASNFAGSHSRATLIRTSGSKPLKILFEIFILKKFRF